MKKICLLFLLAAPLLAGYNTSLEIRKEPDDLTLLISEDGFIWDYLEEGETFERRHTYSSLEIAGELKTYYFSLGKKPLFKAAMKLFRNIVPLTDPLAAEIRSRAANFLDVRLGGRSVSRAARSGSLRFRELVFALKKDADGDGLPDETEYASYGAWPGLRDTDGDGMTDGEEVSAGLAPNLADSDGDGLADNLDPHPLTPEYQLSYAAWSSHWAAVTARKPALFPSLSLSREDYTLGRTPLEPLGEGCLEFSPASLACGEGLPLTNAFSLTAFAEGSLTGIFLCGENVEIIPASPQLIPEEALPLVPEGKNAVPFLARHGVELDFTLVFKETPTESGEIGVLTFGGLRSESLPLNFGGQTPGKPELVYPEDSSRLSQGSAFAWRCERTDVTNYLLSVYGGEAREFSTPGTNCFFTPGASGRYYWQVAAQGAGGTSYSEIRSFAYLDPRENGDSDGDGCGDNEEKLRGSDPNDPRDVPMSFLPSGMTRARKALFFAWRPTVTGGARPLRFRALSPLPFGLKLKEDGLLCGAPSRKGLYVLRLEALDQLDRALEMSLEIKVEEERPGVLKLGGSGRRD